MRKPLALIPAALLLAGCGTATPAEPEPSPVVVEDTFTPPPPVTSTPSADIPEPVTSPKPTDAPKLLDVDAQVLSLATIDPAIAQAHGFIATDYYPLMYDPNTYCSTQDITVCGSQAELWAAFEEDFDKWAAEEMPPVEDVPLEEQQEAWDAIQDAQ